MKKNENAEKAQAKKGDVPMRGNYFDELGTETQTTETPAKDDEPGEAVKTSPKEEANQFATKKPLKQMSLPFHNLQTDGPLTGVFLGMGPITKTTNEPDGFNTYAFFDAKRKSFVVIPCYKVLEKINDECAPGHFMVEITALGVKENQKGKEYNAFDVKLAELEKPFTDFDINEIRSMNG